MFSEKARKIADAILYEGYLLYPYLASALKNRQRFNFGVLSSGDEFGFQVLVRADETPMASIKFRFLHLQTRQVVDENNANVERLEVDGALLQTWQEAVEREIDLQIGLRDGFAAQNFSFAAALSETILSDGKAKIVRAIEAISGKVEIESQQRGENLFRLSVKIFNSSETAALSRSFVSTHALLLVENGAFVSLLEFADEFADEVSKLNQNKLFPVLIANNEMLASPIILYDFPIVAPESDGDFFDATEIDELLTLRILTLTDREKSEAASLDPRAAKILAQAENNNLANLHGTWRALEQPQMSKHDLKINQKVILKPKPRGDVFDLILAGKTATVIRLETDFDDKTHIVVTIDDDEGADLSTGKSVAHQFFFEPDEVEIINILRDKDAENRKA